MDISSTRQGNAALTKVFTVSNHGTANLILDSIVLSDQSVTPVGTIRDGRPFELLNSFAISGNALIVELSTGGSSKAVIADAVRIELL